MDSQKQTGHRTLTWRQALPYVLMAAAVVGVIASFCLTNDRLQTLQDPGFKPACNLNPVISCGTVMKTPQANIVAGIPNSMFGMLAFSALGMLGLTMLAGATFKRWFWIGTQITATAGILFMHFLFFEDVFRIHAICPWCFAVWMVTIPTFFGITVHNIRSDVMKSRRRPIAYILHFIDRFSVDLLVLWYLAIFAVLLITFWYYWRTLL